MSITLVVVQQQYCLLDVEAVSEMRLLQKLSNFSEMKLPPASDINLCSMSYLANMIFTVAIRLSADKPSILLLPGICYDSLQCINNFSY